MRTLELVYCLICLVNVLTLSLGTNHPGISCSFKDNFCGWSVQSSPGVVGWERFEYGSVLQGLSGPNKAYGNDSFYIFFDTTSENTTRGSKTTLLSSEVTNSPNGRCVRFYYHMYGSTMGTLSSGVIVGGKVEEKWSKSGNQNNTWHCKVWSFNSQQNLKIYFEATRGEEIYSIIALDDITLFTTFDRCSECSDLVHTSHITTSLSSTKGSSVTQSTITDTTTPRTEFTNTEIVLIIVGGVLAVALIGTIILAVALSRHRREIAKEKALKKEIVGQSVQRPYTEFPDPSTDYEKLQRENVYDLPDENIPPLPPRPPYNADITGQSILPLTSISASNDTSEIGISTGDKSGHLKYMTDSYYEGRVSSDADIDYANPANRGIPNGQGKASSKAGNSQISEEDDYITPI